MGRKKAPAAPKPPQEPLETPYGRVDPRGIAELRKQGYKTADLRAAVTTLDEWTERYRVPGGLRERLLALYAMARAVLDGQQEPELAPLAQGRNLAHECFELAGDLDDLSDELHDFSLTVDALGYLDAEEVIGLERKDGADEEPE